MSTRGMKTCSRLEKLEDFLNDFNSYAEKAGILPVQVDDTLLGNIKDQLDDELANLKNLEESEIRIQPLFIIALKKLLEKKVDDWTEKYHSDK